MSRNTRLVEIIQRLRDGGLHRAEDLACAFSVSVRTIYRDMEMLIASGVPVAGTRGAGYRITDAIALPPLTLTPEELEALNLGLVIVGQAADDRLKAAAETLGDKIDAAMPADTLAEGARWQLPLHPFADPTRTLAHLPLLRSAIKARQKVALRLSARPGETPQRVIRPLHIEHWGRVWTLTAWCEMRADFRVFRLDLIESADALPDLFMEEPGKRLADYQP